MKILYVCDYLTTFILNEIIELKQRGNDIYILPKRGDLWVESHVIKSMLSENGLHDRIIIRPINDNNEIQKLFHLICTIVVDFLRHPLLSIRKLFSLFGVYSEIRSGIVCYLDTRECFTKEIDVIHAPFSTPPIMDKVYFLSKSMNIPYTLSFRAHDIYLDRMQHETQKRLHIINEASRLITIAVFNKHSLKSRFNIDKNIDIVHGSINTKIFLPKQEFRPPSSIIAVSRLDEQKGLGYLLETCHILYQRNVEYNCTIIGEGEEKEKYTKIINQLQIPNINFVGFLPQNEIKEYLDRSTVFVLPCVTSSNGSKDILPNALKEAMSMEVPVVTSRINGIEELVDDQINGILVPPENPEAIADAIALLFSNPDLRNKMGKEARKKIQKDFDVRVEAKKLEAIFKSINSSSLAS